MDPRLQLRVQRYGWDRASAIYDRAWSQQLAPAQRLLLEMADLTEGEAVVDVACGTGLVTVEAARAVGPGGRVAATDLSAKMVDLTREATSERGAGNVTVHRCDAASLDLPDEAFDAALCALGLMYVPDPSSAVHEMARILRPGGRAVAAVWGERRQCGWAGLFPIVDARVETEVCPLFFQLGTGPTLSHEMEAAGFQEVETRRIPTTLRYSSGQEAVEAAFDGGPVAMAVSRFDEETRGEVEREYLESIAPYRTEQGYAIPGEFVVTRGEKPVR